MLREEVNINLPAGLEVNQKKTCFKTCLTQLSSFGPALLLSSCSSQNQTSPLNQPARKET